MKQLLFNKQFKPHPGQQEVLESDARFITCVNGRRYGKTLLAAHWIIRRAVESRGDYCWLAPTFALTQRGIDAIREVVNPNAYSIRKSVPQCITTYNGSRVFFVSVPDSDAKQVLGMGLKAIVIDEAARISADSFDFNVRPTLSDNLGRCLMVSTPKGRGLLHREFAKGLDPDNLDYDSFNCPSWDNPYFPEEEKALILKNTPSRVLKQEYLAQFLNDGSIFTNMESCQKGSYMPPKGNKSYTAGLDLARTTDYTVLTILDAEQHVVHQSRFNKLAWTAQKSKIASVLRKYNNPTTFVDSTGVGDVIYEDLFRMGLQVKSYKFNNASKCILIENLMLEIENSSISWPKENIILTLELEGMEAKTSSTGLTRYEASTGHDDCVMSLALGAMAHKKYGASTVARTNRAIKKLPGM